MFLAEDEVYIGAKNLLRKNGWKLLGGQPPNGCDHLPVIEIKAAHTIEKGSKDAYKPDLIAYKTNSILLVECKPQHSDSDMLKLRQILSSSSRIHMLFNELKQRNIFGRHKISFEPDSFKQNLFGALAHSAVVYPQDDLFTINVLDINGDGRIISPKLLNISF